MEPPGPREPMTTLERELRPELELVRALGEGRSGRVFLAKEPRLNRLVAVKVLAPELAGARVALARFEREARAAAGLNHPNVVTVHRFGYLSSGVPYLVMQYVKGETLEDKVAAEGLLSPADARKILAQVADALAAAHRSGFVHRDLRPENVLCDEDDGRVLVSDFGLAGVLPELRGTDARLTQAGEVLGVPEYTSPEQLRGEEATERSDVYALGIMGYRLLTGEGPFAQKDGPALMAAHLSGSPRPLRSLREDVDETLAELLEHCLAKDPLKRPRAAFLAQALRETPPDAQATAAAAGQGDLLQDLLRRRMPQIVLVTAVAGFAALNFVDQLSDHSVVPQLVYHLSLATFACSMAAAGVAAWFHGRPGRQRVSPLELVLFAAIFIVWLVTCAVIIIS